MGSGYLLIHMRWKGARAFSAPPASEKKPGIILIKVFVELSLPCMSIVVSMVGWQTHLSLILPVSGEEWFHCDCGRSTCRVCSHHS